MTEPAGTGAPVIVRSPLDHPSANPYELAGRYIAATIILERALTHALVQHTTKLRWHENPTDHASVEQTTKLRGVLGSLNIDAKCDLLRAFAANHLDGDLADLHVQVKRVVKHRHRFAHSLVSMSAEGDLEFLNERTFEKETVSRAVHAGLERDAIEAQGRCVRLANMGHRLNAPDDFLA